MQSSTSPGAPPSAAPASPPPTSRGGTHGLGLTLAAIALVVALVAVGLAFVVPGPAGAAGSSVTAAPRVTYWAAVNYTGSLKEGNNASSAALVATGSFTVTFDDILYGCTFSGVVGTSNITNPPDGTISIATVPSNVYEVKVTTEDSAGAAKSLPFFVAASCPGGLDAVVASNGTFVSGAGVVGVSPEECEGSVHGCYQVVFNQDVSTCAYVAGLGTSFTGTSSSGSVSVSPRNGVADGVWISAWNSAGANSNETFHLSVYC